MTGADVVRYYLRTYADLNNSVLAEIIYQHHPGLYKTSEHVRRQIRYLRKEDEFQTGIETRRFENYPEALLA